MKHAIIGTALILYCLFLTPALVEPSDAIVSPTLIIAAFSVGIPMFIITLWVISGYLALFVGIALVGHSIFRRIPSIVTNMKNPIALALLVAFIILVIYLWFHYVP